jgi:UDP-N-acetyl-2-amino-2-deoxyglucuronate dehydrogenase
MKFALIGTGNAASRHVKAIKTAGGNVTAVCGSDEMHTAAFAKMRGIAGHYTGREQMFRENKIDGVLIASIPAEHYRDIVLAAKYTSVIVVEKPLVIDVREISAVEKLAEKGKSISVVYQHRYDKSYRLLKKALLGEEIVHVGVQMSQYRGKEYYEGWQGKKSEAGGGVLMQQGIHWVNFVFSIIGYDFDVKSASKSMVSGKDVEGAINVVFAKGDVSCSMFFTAMSASMQEKITVYCRDKVIEVTKSGFAVNHKNMGFFGKAGYYLSSRVPVWLNFRRNLHAGNYVDFWKDVIERNSEGRKESLFFGDGVKDVKLIMKAYNKK